jgi:pimeloyl-ACP methyl ester carboxylesterase
MNFRSHLMDRPNPVQTEYPDREDTIEIHTGFSEYLLRRRMDNGKTKFDEIVQCVHEIANELGGSCQLHVTGHSLGGALATIFALYASAVPACASKERPVKLFTFASPYTGGTSFAKAFQQQEQAGLLLHARFHHEYDVVPRMVANTAWHPSGTEYLHTGLRVTLHHDTKKLPSLFFLKDFSHNSLLRQRLGNFFLFHLPWFQLWKLASFHELRTYSHSLLESVGANSKAACKKSLEELYEDYGGSKQ